MSDAKQLDPIAACRLFVESEPTVIDEPAIRAVFGEVVLVSMDQVAQAMGVAAKTVRNTWRRDGMPGEAKRGTIKANKFPLAEIILWHLRKHQSASAARGKDQYTDRIRAAEATRIEAAARMAVRREQEAAGQHVELALVQAEAASFLTQLRDGILEIPRHIKPMLPTKVAERVVSEIDRRIRHELTAYSEKQFSTSKNGVHRNGHRPDDDEEAN